MRSEDGSAMFVMLGKSGSTLTLSLALFLLIGCFISISEQCQRNSDCKNGYCKADMCICNPGWWGSFCQFCRLRLEEPNGVITDGDGQYASPSKCFWLIESQSANSTIHFDFEEFATECNWDHLYIYDGKSIESPLIGVLSGIIKDTRNEKYGQALKLEANSGSAFLYFYSDKLYVEQGFRIKYSISKDCSLKCNFHGHCDKNESCVCDVGWTGLNCNIQTCIAECVNGYCDNTARQCVCNAGFSGASCNVTGDRALWIQHSSKGQDLIQSRASHASAVLGDYMWVFGGFSFNSKPFDNLVRYHIPSDSWEAVNSTEGPSRRYGHSMVAHNASLYIFGGRTGKKETDELWSFDTQSLRWSLLAAQGDMPLSVAGHTATLVDSKMIVLFGYGPQRGYTDKVQEYNLVTGMWTVHNVPTDIIRPPFGHSSAYDPVDHLIYVYGGFVEGKQSNLLTAGLTSYNPTTRTWRGLKNGSVARFLHSAVFLDDLMLVFGGNSHNGTVDMPSDLPCFSMDILAYDKACDEWKRLPDPRGVKALGRYGHAASVFNRTMFVFGGFQGVLFNDILSFTPGPCGLIKDRTSCEMQFSSSDCVWSGTNSTCLGPEQCVQPEISAQEKCSELGQSCRRCTSSLHGCSWCGDGLCVKGRCRGNRGERESSKCSEKEVNSASSYACQGKCEELKCSNLTSCKQCTESVTTPCMWCESQKQCVATNAYAVSFPYGQCLGWNQHGQCSAVKCSGMKTCDECHTLPGCGWCDDGSATGLGQCVPGGDDGPFNKSGNASVNQCPAGRWFFVECPDCQCNGHSKCINKNICKKCTVQTTGPYCEVCARGYFGNAKNGGTCKACECNGHADTCNAKTGKCDCLARYVTGEHCESCEDQLAVFGNATNGGQCYKQLQSNFHFTFNVSNKTSIAFLNIPTEDDIDVDVSVEIKNGDPAFLNLSISRDVREDILVVRNHKIGVFEQSFSHQLFRFAGPDKFKVVVFGIKGFVTLQITFQQKSKFLILSFFITFFACFFSLLFVVALAWKIKVRYSNYVMTRHRVEAMKLMASRPFAKVSLVLTDPRLEKFDRRVSSSAIVVQPTENCHAAVGMFMMRLPGTSGGLTPTGQTGICCATALGTYGNRSAQCHASHVIRGTVIKRSSMMTACCV